MAFVEDHECELAPQAVFYDYDDGATGLYEVSCKYLVDIYSPQSIYLLIFNALILSKDNKDWLYIKIH